MPTAGGEARSLSIPEKFNPAGFTRDGTALYGTYEVNKHPQLATLQLASPNTPAAAAAMPVPLTAIPRGIHSALISPDGSRYALLADPRLPDPLEDVHTVIEAGVTSLYVINADGSGGGWWCPTLRDVAEEGIAWSHDGASLAVLSQTPKIGFHYVRSFIDVCSATGPRHVATIDNAASNIGFCQRRQRFGVPQHDLAGIDARPCLDGQRRRRESGGPHARARCQRHPHVIRH